MRPLSAQDKKSISFIQKTHDFGIIREEDGEVSCVFQFINAGIETISIKKITASCGCTSPAWSENPILPNHKGEFTLTFNPKERYGAFNKGATVFFSSLSGNVTETVSITGFVQFPEKSIEEAFPYDLGNNLLLKDRFFILGSVCKGTNKTQIVEIFNNGEVPIAISGYNLPKYIKVNSTPTTLQPKENGLLTLTYITHDMLDWGYVADSIHFLVNGKKTSATVEFRIDLKEDFSKMTIQEKVDAPIIKLSANTVNLNTIPIGTKKSAVIRIKNLGIQPLIIRKINSEVSYLTVNYKKKTLKSGATTNLTIIVDATYLHPFDFKKRIQIISNDPNNSIINLYVNWQTIK